MSRTNSCSRAGGQLVITFMRSAEILIAGYGQLAQGPLSAIEAYERVAAPFVPTSVVNLAGRKSQRTVVLFDDAFVICGDVSLREGKV